LREPRVGRSAAKLDPGAARDQGLGMRVAFLRVRSRLEVELENLLAPRAQQREEPMRRDLRERLGVAEVIGILRTLGLLAFDDLRADHAAAPQPFAQPAEKLRVLAPALDQDRARAFE